MKVGERIPTLGDLCDIQLITAGQDGFAVARLLTRWLEPEPTLDELRRFTIFQTTEFIDAILVQVRDKAALLQESCGKQKH
ncbi:MAG TPA: hypothetical protein VEU08_14630 [Vicinamibacterales bacterium]|nr:hypothetical protein [Vicinamibacterales bacterium]